MAFARPMQKVCVWGWGVPARLNKKGLLVFNSRAEDRDRFQPHTPPKPVQ